MANKKNGKSKPVESKGRSNTGHRGSRKTPQDEMTLVIQGKGQMFAHFPQFRGQSWAGAPGVFGSFNMKQALLNKAAGLC